MRDEGRLATAYGKKVSAQLMPIILELENDFYSSDAWHTAKDIAEMGRTSSAEFTKRHPELPKKAVEAFAWSYTFDHK
jgi:hypothetical protein